LSVWTADLEGLRAARRADPRPRAARRAL